MTASQLASSLSATYYPPLLLRESLMNTTELKTQHERYMALPYASLGSDAEEVLKDVLNVIHSGKRRYLYTSLFGEVSRICSLNFIGADEYFISEQGTVWDRGHIYLNRQHQLTKGYVPEIVLDYKYPYPWVFLPSVWNRQGSWIPVNLLLGWAFNPVKTVMRLYAISMTPGVLPLHSDALYWSETPSLTTGASILPSKYIGFMDFLYAKKPNYTTH